VKRFAILAVLAAAQPAYAKSSCGSGSDGGSSVRDHRSDSSSSDSSSSSSDSSTTVVVTDSTPACVDDTDVVGFRKCKKFGTWARVMSWPRMFVELGTSVRQFGSGLGARSGTVAHGSERFAFHTVMAQPESVEDTAVVSVMRAGVGIGRGGAYAAGELELGGLTSPAAATAEMTTSGSFGSPTVVQERGFAIGGLGVAGYRATLGKASLAFEGAAGVRSVEYHFASAYQDCAQTTSISDTRGVVEARVRAETWLGPWISAGATVGSSVISRGDWMAGAYLGFHSRAFGGGR
jgi:hypothetical protein